MFASANYGISVLGDMKLGDVLAITEQTISGGLSYQTFADLTDKPSEMCLDFFKVLYDESVATQDSARKPEHLASLHLKRYPELVRFPDWKTYTTDQLKTGEQDGTKMALGSWPQRKEFTYEALNRADTTVMSMKMRLHENKLAIEAKIMTA